MLDQPMIASLWLWLQVYNTKDFRIGSSVGADICESMIWIWVYLDLHLFIFSYINVFLICFKFIDYLATTEITSGSVSKIFLLQVMILLKKLNQSCCNRFLESFKYNSVDTVLIFKFVQNPIDFHNSMDEILAKCCDTIMLLRDLNLSKLCIRSHIAVFPHVMKQLF